ncbi:MAG TPA: MBL fold metallo-hydrolase [Candidatus Hydrogenedentes bacterium]|nr:MBL fold metallo-hydrolase [Candidatus Hydrogenedentota bacterium]
MASWLNYNSDGGATPKKAAAVIMFVENAGSLLLVRRNQALAFMGGHHAFPGGSVSEYDTGVRVRGAADAEQAGTLTAAVRELFEETGILLVEGAVLSDEKKAETRVAVLNSPDIFEDMLAEAGLYIEAEKFIPVGRWITPTFAPMRFDTQYFLYCAGEPFPASPIGHEGEITETGWFNTCEALDLRANGVIQMSTPVVFVLRRLAVLPLDKAIERLQHTPGFSDIIHDYIEPAHGIHIVPVPSRTLPPASHTNCMLVGESELAIIDPGIDDAAAWTRFESHLDEILEMAGGKLCAILLTHDHPDHSASVHRLARRHDAPVYAHQCCQEKDIALEDGMGIALSGAPPWHIRCIHTPGHHPGHFAFYEEATDTLICGDMVSNPGTIMIDPETGGDMGAYLDSLDRLSALKPKLTVPAHGAPLMFDAGPDLFRKTIAHRRMREARIRDAIGRGASTLEEILDMAYDDTPKSLHPLALRQLQAHLIDMNIDM